MIPVDTQKKPEEYVENDESGDEYDRPSKSQRKRESTALQDLGAALVELSAERLAKIEMTDSLRDAIRDAQRITKHEARRRQMQYIGKLMRSADTEPIRAALDAMAGVSAAENAHLHRLERLRLQLLEDESAALAEIVAAWPGSDLQQLRQLRRNALKEEEQGKPPRAFREIFRVLKSLAEIIPNE
jgi:ribosome-associated protein